MNAVDSFNVNALQTKMLEVLSEQDTDFLGICERLGVCRLQVEMLFEKVRFDIDLFLKIAYGLSLDIRLLIDDRNRI